MRKSIWKLLAYARAAGYGIWHRKDLFRSDFPLPPKDILVIMLVN